MPETPSILHIQATLRRTDFGACVKDKWRDRFTDRQLSSLNLSPKECKRQEIINEIIATEEEYVNDLKFVHRNFWKPACQNTMPVPEQVGRLFANIEDMIRLHDHLYMSLQARQNSQSPVVQSISDIFLSFVERFDIYASYLVNYTGATRQIDRMMQSANKYGSFLKERERLPGCRKLPLQAFLIAPVQRLAKYPLFFKGLLDVTPEDSPDYDSICQLHQKMDVLIRRLEDEKRKEDTFERLAHLELTMKGLGPFKLAVQDRKLVHEGILYHLVMPKKTPSSSCGSPPVNPLLFHQDNIIAVYVLLFDDIVLWTQKRKDKNRKEVYKLLEPPAKITNVEDIPDQLGYTNLLECTSVHNGRTTFVLRAANLKEKSLWVSAFQSVLRKHTNRGDDDSLDQWWFYYHVKEQSRKNFDEK